MRKNGKFENIRDKFRGHFGQLLEWYHSAITSNFIAIGNYLHINPNHKTNQMKLPKNGVARELRSYFGSILIFVFITGLVMYLIKNPVLETNKETILMLIGSIAASIPLLISAITGTKTDDIQAMQSSIEKKDQQIQMLISAKDDLEKMVIDLQSEIIKNNDMMMDKFILKTAIDYDLENNPPKDGND